MSLRLIELIVSEQHSRDFNGFPETIGVIGAWTHRMDGGLSVVRVLVRSERTEPVLREFEARYGNSPGFRMTIIEAEATIPQPPPPPEEPEDDAKEGNGANGNGEDTLRIACAELVQKLSGSASINRVFILTVILSTVVAAIGLVRDNMAVIIGAMVIAPLLTPNMALSLATTLGDPRLARDALRVNGIGILVALVVAVAIGTAIPVDLTVREISSRTVVSAGDIVLGLAAGSAGALAYTTGISAAVVGVMVAVALLPPLVTAGLLIGVGEFTLAGRAFLLLAANVICVNLAGVATFVWQGVRPDRWWQAERSRRMLRVSWAVWTSLLAVLSALIWYAGKAA